MRPLGDQGVMVYFEGEGAASAFARQARRANWGWLIDVVQAYRSVAVFYDQALLDFQAVADELIGLEPTGETSETGRMHLIPCCYGLGPDLDRVARQTGLSRAEIIGLHAGTMYTVYAIGFCPGFPYLGYLPDKLCGVPRLETPRLKVEAGSVGLTGRQTGIYTEERPGGWNILGRTPLELVHVVEGYFPLRTGDRVQFQAIGEEAYRGLLGKRLEE